MKLLITGGSGFIGRNLIEQLQTDYCICAPSSSELNLLDKSQVENYLNQNHFDVVIHTAKRDGVKEKKQLTEFDILDSNLRMFFNLERCNHLYGKMIYYGSGAEYDRRAMGSMTKESDFGKSIPRDPYGFSKYIMSKMVFESTNIYDLRLFGVFGKYEEYTKRFISNAIYNVIHNYPISISQNVYFDYLFVDDLVKITRWFIENVPRKRHYNVCRGKSIDLLSLANIVKKQMNTSCEIQISKQGFKSEYSGSNELLMKEINGFHFTNIDFAIKDLCDYYLKLFIGS